MIRRRSRGHVGVNEVDVTADDVRASWFERDRRTSAAVTVLGALKGVASAPDGHCRTTAAISSAAAPSGSVTVRYRGGRRPRGCPCTGRHVRRGARSSWTVMTTVAAGVGVAPAGEPVGSWRAEADAGVGAVEKGLFCDPPHRQRKDFAFVSIASPSRILVISVVPSTRYGPSVVGVILGRSSIGFTSCTRSTRNHRSLRGTIIAARECRARNSSVSGSACLRSGNGPPPQRAVQPPSTMRVVPVTSEAGGDAGYRRRPPHRPARRCGARPRCARGPRP